MKLRNKKTGGIIDIYKGEITLHYNQGRKTIHFKRLEDLEEWEDYEEPKEYWYIDCYGEVLHAFYNGNEWDGRRKLIGNYFDTREEAEKAVEKLKAWKRLKDKGFKFDDWDFLANQEYRNFEIYLKIGRLIDAPKDKDELRKDLDLLFGGEE